MREPTHAERPAAGEADRHQLDELAIGRVIQWLAGVL
jgi:hypothetical protein